MGVDSRLNVLLTHGVPASGRTPAGDPSPWYQTLSTILSPMGVKTFEATTAPQAVSLIEHYPIHLAVVDTRLAEMGELGVLRVIQKIREQAASRQALSGGAAGKGPTQVQAAPEVVDGLRVQVRFGQGPKADGGRVQVRFGEAPAAPATVSPTVILLTPQRDEALLREALKFEAFSVLNEPVDVNLLLEIMARAMRRFHHNLWPQ